MLDLQFDRKCAFLHESLISRVGNTVKAHEASVDRDLYRLRISFGFWNNCMGSEHHAGIHLVLIERDFVVGRIVSNRAR
jgi:hypothetical protein